MSERYTTIAQKTVDGVTTVTDMGPVDDWVNGVKNGSIRPTLQMLEALDVEQRRHLIFQLTHVALDFRRLWNHAFTKEGMKAIKRCWKLNEMAEKAGKKILWPELNEVPFVPAEDYGLIACPQCGRPTTRKLCHICANPGGPLPKSEWTTTTNAPEGSAWTVTEIKK